VRDFLKGELARGATYSNRASGIRVAFSRKGNAKAERVGETLLRLHAALPEVLSEGVPLDVEAPREGTSWWRPCASSATGVSTTR
jgi:hypothetical protein